jgi:sugar lactone lactonase YvrE
VTTPKAVAFILSILCAGLACAQTGQISTYAGNGNPGFSGDGGAATSAMLFGPIGLAVDSNGNLLIADTSNSRIRKVSGGIITTVAGGGTGGDGLPATQVQLFSPCDVKVDAAGNLYISESCISASGGSGGGGSSGSGGGVSNRVLRLDAATGILRTIAGGITAGFSGDGGPPGSASQLNTPGGLAIDGSGTLYIADSGNNRVRRIDGSTGIITTVAGNGVAAFAGDGGSATAASLNNPTAVAVDAAGTLYIADAGNSRIRRVDAGTGVITTLAGTGNTTYNGDGTPAAGANLGFPTALQVNGAGNLLLTDSLDDRVRLIDTSTGLIWTIAGVGPIPPVCCGGGDGGPAPRAPLTFPAGVAVSPMGPLFIAEHAGQRVREVALQNPLVTTAVNVTASGVSVAPGSPLTLTAVLSVMTGSPANVTGNVQFLDNATGPLGGAPVVNGSSSFTTSSLQVGTHSLSAEYIGDSVFGPSISLPVSVTITNPQSSTALAATPSPAISGQPVTLTAAVTPSTATGSVNFFNGTTSLGAISIANGTATLAGVIFTAGSDSLTAQYSGDINLPASTSPAITLVVKAASSVVVTSSANPSTAGQAVTFTATVTPSAATGTVQFSDNGSSIGTASIVSGAATFSTSALTSGPHSITAAYGGDANDTSATSSALTQTVQVATSVAVTSSQNPSQVGASVTFTASVTPATASGTVQFLDGAAALGTATLAGGSASFSTSALTQGVHYITAVYSGDTGNAGSTSAALPQSVRLNAGLTLASSANPSTTGQSVTFTVTVNSAATGTAQFLDGGTVLGTVPVSSGAAAFSTSTLTLGTHSITATYSGDATYLGSTSALLTQTINKIATTTALTSAPNPSIAGSGVTFTATVTPAAATGTIQFLDGTTVLGTGTLASGSATFTTSTLTPGTHSVTAVYSGDASNAASTSAGVSQSVKLSPGLTLTSSQNPSTVGQTVAFTANLNPAATGTVQFLDGTAVLATVTVSSGAATFSTSALTQGAHSITAAYGGDSNYMSSTSSALTQTVNLTATTTALTSTQNPALVGGAVSFIATVSPATATGTVQFLDGSTVLGTGTLSNGSASFTTSSLTQGAHTITAVYSGDTADAASTSAALSQSMKLSAGMTAGINPSPGVTGQNVTLTANVAAAATGTVTFTDGSTVLATVTVASGATSYSTTSLSQGSHTLGIGYSGDATYMGQSVTVSETVLGATSISVASNVNPAATGQTVTFTATVTPTAATGNVQFYDGQNLVATVALSGGTAGYSISTLTTGSHAITANYLGSSTYTSSFSSNTVTEVVKTNTSVALASAPNPSLAGAAVTFTAIVTPATATGAVQFLDGTAVLGTAALANGSASLSTSALAQGAHSITAIYSGDANDTSSTSAALSQTVKVAPGMTAGVSPSPAMVGQTVVITANINAGATGTVTFTDGSTVLATVPVASGAASYSTTSLTQGLHTLGASYSGDATYMSGSATVSETVLGATSISVTSTANPSAAGQNVTFTATVTPAAATGNVQFYDGQNLVATVALSGGTAAYSTSTLTAVTHSIKANYLGSATYAASFSSTLIQVVKTNASVALASAPNPSVVGAAITFTATVAPSTATGTVQFLDGTTALGTGTLASGSASFSTSALTQGTHSISASYSGDANDTPTTSTTLTQTVNPPPPAAPSNLTAAAAGSSQINLTWIASPTSGVTYDVYSSTTSGFVPSASNRIAAGVSATSYSASGLSASTTYYFRVTAVNAGGESAATNQASAKTAGALSCHVSYSVTNQWNVGFQGAFSIKNTGSTAINSWTLTWTWPGNQAMTQSWNSNYTQSGANITLTNATWNATIAPGATLSGMGFLASYSGTNTAPTAFHVNGTPCQ